MLHPSAIPTYNKLTQITRFNSVCIAICMCSFESSNSNYQAIVTIYTINTLCFTPSAIPSFATLPQLPRTLQNSRRLSQ